MLNFLLSRSLWTAALMFVAVFFTATAFSVANAAPVATAACPSLLNYSAPRLQDETPQDLCRFSGQVVLVVNTASYCGYTPQYEGLEKLYARYQKQGFAVLGFPSNDFKQETTDKKAIAELCFNTYGVKFPMFAPASVTGAKAQPFYAALAKASGEQPAWNFHKYLLNRQGKVIGVFPSATEPTNKQLTEKIEQALAAR